MTMLVLERPVALSPRPAGGYPPTLSAWVREVLAWHGLHDDAPVGDAVEQAAWARPTAPESAWAAETLAWHGATA